MQTSEPDNLANKKYFLASDFEKYEILKIKKQIKQSDCMCVKLLHPNAQLPKRQSSEDAGYDIYTPESATILAHSKKIISTGIAIQLPECRIANHIYCFNLISRSGLSAKHSIEKGAGLIDKSYRGELKVVLYNHSDKDYNIQMGERICQGIIIPVAISEVLEVKELSNTDRGTNGFGSTGN